MWALPMSAFGLRLGEEGDASADLRILLGPAGPPSLPLAYERRAAQALHPTSTVYSNGQVWLERFHHLASQPAFAIDPGARTITVYPDAAPADVVEHHLFDHVVPSTLQLLGRLCFHASAVAFERGVVAFAAPSGTGKSTLAAFLSKSRSLFSDDALAIELVDGRVLALPGAPGNRLRADSARAIAGTEPTTVVAGKARVRRAVADSALRLVALCCLERVGPDEAPRLDRRSALETLPDLLQQIHRLAGEDRGVLEREMTQLMDVLAVVPTYRLRLPAAFDRLPEVEHLLTQL
ncbi:MAG: hypothetical protein JNL79_17905 [Myxococcales bacterium]|nr:hypothetical protein [Myxococcales bacterium]